MNPVGKYGVIDGLHRLNLKQRTNSGIVSLGMVISIPEPSLAEIAALAGCDFVRIEMEHNLFNVESIQHIIRAADCCGIASYVRVDQYDLITPLLDFGVEGLMFPHVRSAAQAKDLVDRVKYAPVGRRGIASSGRAQRYGTMKFLDYVKETEQDVFLQVQIEDKEGIENMEEIIATPGVDYICSGRNDIAQALGLLGQSNDSRVSEIENRILDIAGKHGKRCTFLVDTIERAQYYYDKGVRTFPMCDDKNLLFKAVKAKVDLFKGLASP